MKIKDVRALDEKKLHEKLAEAREKVTKLRFGVANQQDKKVRDVRKLKREIARYLTVLNEKRHGIVHAEKKVAKTEEKKEVTKEAKK